MGSTSPGTAPISPKFVFTSMVGEITGGSGAALQLCGNQTLARHFVIGAERIGTLQAGFKIGYRKSAVRGFVGQFEFLAGRQSDHTGQRNLLFCEIVPGRNQ